MSTGFRSPLVRLDNNLWRCIPQNLPVGIDQIQIQTPLWDEPALSYRLARVVQKALKRHDFATDFYVYVRDSQSGIAGRWRVSLQPTSSAISKFWQFFPFTATYPDRRIVQLSVTQSSSFWAEKLFCFYMEKPVKMPPVALPMVPNGARFSDPFTELARIYHQTIDPYYVFQEGVLGAFRYVLDANGLLSLTPITGAESEKAENNKAATAFRDYIVSQYGRQKLDYVNAAYGFSLDDIVAQGGPLMPDHVFKTNIGVCNIEMSDLEQLYQSLLTRSSLPQSVVASIERLFPGPRAFHAFVAALPRLSSIRELPVDQFNKLVEMIMPTSRERDLAYSGRKIRHLAITGWNTMGDQEVFTPVRDLFEFMQVYDAMQKTEDWENYYELLTHIAAKKNLFRKNVGAPGWHVGVLLPAPKAVNGQERWYFNDAFVDDGEGNVNYVLLPACEHYRDQGKPLPYIKSYRSTSADRNSPDSLESIAADLNPYGPPGSIHPKDSFLEEKSYFDRRTIPLWLALLLRAQKTKEPAHFKEAIDEYLFCLRQPGHTPKEKLEMAQNFQRTNEPKAIEQFLLDEGTLHRELAQFKVAQDIACVGHSLGASLAQFGIYYFGPRRRRIPLPNHNYICYSSRGPAIDNKQDKVFMAFGQKYAALLISLGQQWTIRQQMEYGDFIPESGQSHLGTTNYNPILDHLWLRQNITVFRPLDTAQVLPITTMATHGRRTGMAVVGRDYSIQSVSVAELQHYDHDWWMSSKLINLFGYRILRSSKVVEGVRALAAFVSRPFLIVILKIYNAIWPSFLGPRDKDGAIYLKYRR